MGRQGYDALAIARRILLDASEDDLQYLIWNETAFGFCDEETFRRQIWDIWRFHLLKDFGRYMQNTGWFTG